MKKYILDTDIISFLWDAKSPYHQKIVDKLETLEDSDSVAISIVSIYELTYGIYSFGVDESELKDIFTNALNMIKNDEDISLYSLDFKSAEHFSKMKFNYKNHTGIPKKSAKKNDLDLLIASTAVAQNAILVSNDNLFAVLDELEPALQYENWLS